MPSVSDRSASGKGQLRVARRLDAEGKHGEAAIGLDGGGGRRCEDRADAVTRCVRVARGEHTGNERAVFNARAFDNGIVVAQTELHGGKTCVAGQLRRDGKGLPNVRQLVRGCELERRACGAGKPASAAAPPAAVRCLWPIFGCVSFFAFLLISVGRTIGVKL